GLNLQAQANQVLELAPFVFEYNLNGPQEIESEKITTSGIIKTIFVSYESVGQVRLEVSANAGIAYAKIINGQPLLGGFVPGNQLRLKINIGQNSSLKKLILGFTDSSGVQRLLHNPDLANYKYHQEIKISGGSQELFNYPLHLNVTRDDLYFTAADGQTPLYYYLENKTNCYVNVLQISKEGTKIYMHYNDIIASPERAKQSRNYNYNDGNKVFPFFEDFNAETLDAEKWEIISGFKKEHSLKDGYLKLKDCLFLTRNFKTKQAIIEFKAKVEENASIQVVVRSKANAQGLPAYEQIVYSSNYPGAEHTIAINNIAKINVSKPIEPLTYYMYKATLNASGILFERSSENYKKQAAIKFFDVGNLEEGYLGIKSEAAALNAGNVYFDWIRARPYVEVEPMAEVVK
ncbi:MAG: DUF2341 domain-containing protein, partial [Candidatus Omnitrophica bacterium]|nr:DUF2341 domain-containing protein [Candidatus Omnitrophota bacterium]